MKTISFYLFLFFFTVGFSSCNNDYISDEQDSPFEEEQVFSIPAGNMNYGNAIDGKWVLESQKLINSTDWINGDRITLIINSDGTLDWYRNYGLNNIALSECTYSTEEKEISIPLCVHPPLIYEYTIQDMKLTLTLVGTRATGAILDPMELGEVYIFGRVGETD